MSRYLPIKGGQSGCRIVYMAEDQIGSGSAAGLSRQARDCVKGLLAALERAFADI